MQLLTVVICLVASDSVFGAESAETPVRILSFPSQSPFRLGQTVQLICDVDAALRDSVTYEWRIMENMGMVNHFSESYSTTYFSYDTLHYCWYSCSVISNGQVLGSADRLIEVQGFLQTDEAITRAFSLGGEVTMNVNISDYSLIAHKNSSLAWYRNGIELTTGERVIITNDKKSLSISNMVESDAGRYEVKFKSLGYDSPDCDRNLLPMLENLALYAPVTFLLQESKLPTYDPMDIILDYAIPAYNGVAPRGFTIENVFQVNAAAVLDLTQTYDHLYKDGVYASDKDTSFNLSYGDFTTQMLRITYTNTDAITGHYVHTSYANYRSITRTCPRFAENMKDYYFYIPIFVLHRNIRIYGSITCPSIANRTCPTLASTLATCPTDPPPVSMCRGNVNWTKSAMIPFFLGMLCGAVAELGMLVVYMSKKIGRKDEEKMKHLSTTMYMPAKSLLYEKVDGHDSVTSLYEDMPTTHFPEQQMPQNIYYVLEK